MAPLSQSALSGLIGTIYDCTLAPSRWEAALREVARAFHCEKVILSLNDLRSDRVLIGKSVGWEPHWLQERERHTPEIHAVLTRWLAHGRSADEPFVASREIPPIAAQNSDYVRRCLAPQDIVDVVHYFLIRTPESFSELVLMRRQEQGSFGAAEMELGKLLLPHLRRAVTISKVLDACTIDRTHLAETLDLLRCGVMMIDESSSILHANRAARRLIRTGEIVENRQGKLQFKSASVQRELRQAVTIGARDEARMGKAGVAVRLTDTNSPPLFAHVLPLTGSELRTHLQPAAVAAVFIDTESKEHAPVEAFAAMFNLTPRESCIVSGLLAGDTLAHTARDLGIARTTAKTHLENIFRKTGVSRQTELVRLASLSTPFT